MVKVSILLVDDELGLRLTLGEILRLSGFDVTTAGTVAEALAAIHQRPFNVLLTDLKMPEDGFSVILTMGELQPQARIIVISGYPDALEAIPDRIRQLVYRSFAKPTDIPELIRGIKESQPDT